MPKFLKILTLLLCLQSFEAQSAAQLPGDRLLNAVKRGDTASLQQILPQRKDLNQPLLADRPQSTLLMYAVSKKAPLPVVEILLKNGADAFITDSHGRPVIIITAIRQNNLALLDKLLAKASPQLLNRLLLQSIANRGSPELVSLLIEHGADVNYTHKTGITPLLMAVSVSEETSSDNRSAVIKLLLEKGADPQKRFLGLNAKELAELNRTQHDSAAIRHLVGAGAG